MNHVWKKKIQGFLKPVLALFYKRKNQFLFLEIIVVLCFWFSLPDPLFTTPNSTTLEDRNKELLGAQIANDGQWRFPMSNDPVPEKFKKCIILYEDRYFYRHPGINPISLGRALVLDIKAKRIVAGGSTLSMQVIRLSRQGKERNILQKLIELTFAFRMELSYSKEKILKLYSSQAPFGGNVVGLDAASWRYFGRGPEQLSWAESATLAILPNSPSLIYPGKNQQRLLIKRNKLLRRLYEEGFMDGMAFRLSLLEPLPGKPYPLPQLAPHLLARAIINGHKGKRLHTTVDRNLQKQVQRVLEYHHDALKENGIHNAATIVIDVESGEALSYVGNVQADLKNDEGYDVDIIMSPRSTGSILKPFLYASMLHSGELLPNTLVADIPTQIAGYTPKNYNLGYDGAVPAKRAIARSLNIPAVRLLQEYRVERFYQVLKKLGMTTLNYSSGHYGLSLILGGAEGSLWDLGGIYASMARTLNHYDKFSGTYTLKDFHPPTYIIKPEKDKKPGALLPDKNSILSASAIWLTFEAMAEVARPDEEAAWADFSSLGKVAWKTGTSFGSRDGWAIGCTPRYVVAVWVGNADGEGRTGLTGIGSAAPILFDIFSLLKPAAWFNQPYDNMERVPICRESGHRAGEICENIDSNWISKAGLKTAPCPYHRIIHLNSSGEYQVNDQCEDPANMRHVPWFVLPPVQEWYYKSRNPLYQVQPPFRPDCQTGVITRNMDLIYPRNNAKIYVPIELDGKTGRTVFEVGHRNSQATVYWHIDKQFVGTTRQFHEMAFNPSPGEHILTVVDNNGETAICRFEIIAKK